MYVCAKQPLDFPQRKILVESRAGSVLVLYIPHSNIPSQYLVHVHSDRDCGKA